MMLTRSHVRSIGWAAILAVCFALTVALSFRVNAVKSQVRLSERHIARLQAETGLLETEFETRANQQQLTALNEVEFGYQAPTPGQYLESERQLASLGKPRGPDAPPMIRVAAADPQPASDSVLPAMVNPLTGKALAAELPRLQAKPADKPAAKVATKPAPANLAERLARVEPVGVERLSHVEKTPRLIVKTSATKTPAAKLADGKAATKPGKSEPKLAKAEPRGTAVVKAVAKAAPAKGKPEAKLTKATPAKPVAGKVARVAVKSPAKAHGKSDRVAFD